MTDADLDAALVHAAYRHELTSRVKSMLVERLELPIPPAWITDDQPLFGRGLELDSLDALELTMGIDAEFGIAVYEEDRALLGSVAAFVDRVLVTRAETEDAS
ncbi:acyl carrier protein [Cryptosporangium aurantiacum]|uniref:Acyl carrier protein n=1 Tax=Cryptosporangium aurantiacum TaxID=134849 RepID=A0A1M7QAN5_9ACTN|nr:phosphopantetheine-binding protein [Cryptosporangium aurantiacum]SHN27688.1 acyl carrier protein [Cryptosporangium aurantiacum]